jgi:hypothetical protein
MIDFRSRHNRRSFLRLGGVFGLSLAKILRAEARGQSAETGNVPARNMILIWLGGGPSTIDMWDMKPSAPDAIRGEFQRIQTTVPGLQICEHLPEMAKSMDKCTLIRSLKHSIPAHGPGSQYLMTGHLPSAATEYPSLGSVTVRMLDSVGGVPPYITFGGPPYQGAGYLGAECNPFELDEAFRELPRGVSLGADVDIESFEERVRLRNIFDRRFDALNEDRIARGLDTFQHQAVDVLRQDAIRKSLDVESVSEEDKQRYGSSAVGINSLRARRLIEAGVRFVTVGTDGWDTHVNNFTTLRNNLLPQLDKALSALISDLERRGILDETIVCCCGEFGRTPQINGNKGRDHWSSAMSLVVAGGGFCKGYCHGATNEFGTTVTSGAMTPADLAATLLSRLGIDPASIIHTLSGRTMPLIRDGRLVEKLVN